MKEMGRLRDDVMQDKWLHKHVSELSDGDV